MGAQAENGIDGWRRSHRRRVARRVALDAVLRIAVAQSGTRFKRTFDWDLYTYSPGWDSDLLEPEPHGFE
jgi:hypothetical protein